MLQLHEKDVTSFYDDVQEIISQNLACNLTEQDIEKICNDTCSNAKAWLRQPANKDTIFPPLLMLFLESLVRKRSSSLLENKCEPEGGLYYGNRYGYHTSGELMSPFR